MNDPNDFTWSDWAEQQIRLARSLGTSEDPLTEETELETAGSRCEDCHWADLGLFGKRHCGNCYCCKGK